MPQPPNQLTDHLSALAKCTRCPKMHKPVVVGRPVLSQILLVGQAPGTKEPELGRPFAWTAGKTLFKWIHTALNWDEDTARNRIYFAAVCRCFPGKNPKGGDRVPDPGEIDACSHWLKQEIQILKPKLILPVGKLAISQFLQFNTLSDVIGQQWTIAPSDIKTHSTKNLFNPTLFVNANPPKSSASPRRQSSCALYSTLDILPLPHPSGASTWHRTEPGATLLKRALQLLSEHPAGKLQ